MQLKSFTRALSAGLLAVALCNVSSCKKDSVKETDEDTTYASEQAQLEKTFDDVEDITDRAATGADMSNMRVTGSCATITHDSISTPHKLIVNFGPTDCLCGDGVYRRGKIILTYNGRYRDSGYVHTITFDSFFVNSNQVKGTKTVTNMGRNSSGQPYYAISVNGSLVLDKGAGTRNWVSTRTRTWTKGYSTVLRSDDEYEVTGSGTVTRVDGSTFTARITSALVWAVSCDWISKGTVEITLASGKIRTLDYGSGTCDATATVSAGGKSYTIVLRR